MGETVYGYCDRFDYRGGDTVGVHLHASDPEVVVDVVRLHGADDRVGISRPAQVAIAGIAPREVIAHRRAIHRGSFARIEGLTELQDAALVAIALRFRATLAGNGARQVLASTLDGAGQAGLALAIGGDGRPELLVAGGDGLEVVCRGPRVVVPSSWSAISLELSIHEGVGTLRYGPLRALPGAEGAGAAEGTLSSGARPVSATGRLILAGREGDPAEGDRATRDSFNGRLEDVSVSCSPPDGGPTAIVAHWDFARELATARIVDVGRRGHHGVLVNGPTRGVTGSTWRGEEVDHRLAPDQYAAIHFHEDDLDDVAWPQDTALALPSDLPSGIYAVRVVAAGGCEDRIPFVVLPERRPARKRPPIAVLLPTLTYQAYANSKLSDRIDYAVFGLSERDYHASERERQLAGVPELYGSLYDVHADGSGRSFSTLRRPILTMRPEWHSALQHAPRHLAADLYLTSWLEELGQEFDVLTDHMLDEEGVEALAGYRVVVTGSHPEYVTAREISALEEHVVRGGRLMYLGGNGFYWVTSVDPDRPHVIEVRRGNAGTRTWDSPPGETHHASTGEPGGLWRHRGRAPNALVGVGMASQGWDLKAPGYRRTRESFASELAWMFEGFADDEHEFGDEGLVMDGAAGDEIDRYDVELGSPRHGVVVASSAGHSRFYKIVHEDLPMSRDGLGGDENENVRSDVTYVPWAGGGGVFATGSITWAGAMAVRNFDNLVARLTTNVLRRFLDPAELPPARALDVEATA